MPSPSQLAVCLQVGAVVLGHWWGVSVHYPGRPPSIYTTCVLLAGLVMLWGAIASLVTRPVEEAGFRTSIAALLYSVGLVLCEPFLDVHQQREIIVAAFVLAPLLLAVGHLVSCQAWASALGASLFVFTSSAMITSNANVADAGSGFFGWWVT